MRQLEELNLVDDFLANSLTGHEVYGEPAARCILECILGRKIGKRKVPHSAPCRAEACGKSRKHRGFCKTDLNEWKEDMRDETKGRMIRV